MATFLQKRVVEVARWHGNRQLSSVSAKRQSDASKVMMCSRTMHLSEAVVLRLIVLQTHLINQKRLYVPHIVTELRPDEATDTTCLPDSFDRSPIRVELY
jgi:hypothetical protein